MRIYHRVPQALRNGLVSLLAALVAELLSTHTTVVNTALLCRLLHHGHRPPALRAVLVGHGGGQLLHGGAGFRGRVRLLKGLVGSRGSLLRQL